MDFNCLSLWKNIYYSKRGRAWRGAPNVPCHQWVATRFLKATQPSATSNKVRVDLNDQKWWTFWSVLWKTGKGSPQTQKDHPQVSRRNRTMETLVLSAAPTVLWVSPVLVALGTGIPLPTTQSVAWFSALCSSLLSAALSLMQQYNTVSRTAPSRELYSPVAPAPTLLHPPIGGDTRLASILWEFFLFLCCQGQSLVSSCFISQPSLFLAILFYLWSQS